MFDKKEIQSDAKLNSRKKSAHISNWFINCPNLTTNAWGIDTDRSRCPCLHHTLSVYLSLSRSLALSEIKLISICFEFLVEFCRFKLGKATRRQGNSTHTQNVKLHFAARANCFIAYTQCCRLFRFIVCCALPLSLSLSHCWAVNSRGGHHQTLLHIHWQAEGERERGRDREGRWSRVDLASWPLCLLA